ncbi:hypothetical protein LXL04_038119 [Taraxacum kok-saghyz]
MLGGGYVHSRRRSQSTVQQGLGEKTKIPSVGSKSCLIKIVKVKSINEVEMRQNGYMAQATSMNKAKVDDDQPWIEVTHKNRKSVFQCLGIGSSNSKSNQDYLAGVTTTVYVANFPSHLSEKELWRICGTAGVVVDVFIGRNRNKRGQMFAFVRFIKVKDSKILVSDLCNIRIGTLNLHANVLKHPRKAVSFSDGGNTASVKHPKPVTVSKQASQFPKASVGKASYASVLSKEEQVRVKHQEKVTEVPKVPKEKNASVVHLDSLVHIDNAYPYAVLGCFKDFRAIANIRCMCQGEGFLDIEPLYLGGLWVLIDFPNVLRRDAFMAHSAFDSWFSVLKLWHNDFVVTERIAWLEVEGIPLLAWCNDTFTKIASKWGDLVFVDNSDVTNRFSVRIGVKTLYAPLVFESTFAMVQGVEYWTPTFIEGFKDDIGNNYYDASESDNSVTVRIETVSHEHTTHAKHKNNKIYSGSVQSLTYVHSR